MPLRTVPSAVVVEADLDLIEGTRIRRIQAQVSGNAAGREAGQSKAVAEGGKGRAQNRAAHLARCDQNGGDGGVVPGARQTTGMICCTRLELLAITLFSSLGTLKTLVVCGSCTPISEVLVFSTS